MSTSLRQDAGPMPVTPLRASNDTKPPKRITKVCCVGAGYVGGPTSAVMAIKNPQIQVTVVDYDAKRIAAWQSDNLPIFEPGLLGVVKPARDGIPNNRAPNLFFSTDVDRCIAEAELILLSVNTPTKMLGQGAGHASELCYLESAVRKIGEVAESSKIIVEKSTVPCRAAETLRDVLRATGKPGVDFEILSNPEFLAEGTAIQNLLEPDRVLIGSLNTPQGLEAARALAAIYTSWVDAERIITINLYSSELAKLAANALLAQRISSINALSAMCEAVGADIDEVSFAVGLDKRIGSRMLKASVGFGGSCFRKDILSLAYIAESLHLFEVAEYWRSVININEYQKDRFTRRIVRCLFNSLSNKSLAILGFAYKKNTGDTRETAAITVINNLLAEGANVRVYDPQVKESQIRRDLEGSSASPHLVRDKLTVWSSTYEACAGADAVVILTEWDEFSNKSAAAAAAGDHVQDARNGARTEEEAANGPMSWKRVSQIMRKPMYVFDGRNVVDPAPLEALGFRVESVGKSRSGS
ncbi:UDP-glucose 6-dehydrogenase [Decorospora gaudefroyi]|uniref:UDP-glucose 6-dehydrogenase n=1 Tax=Decorospora gaudefroyi TaxID=184978 RepID=A0A6A5KQU6_9PLEO|nr:UDP-glucose 6-dehydrogenase [Decorospora gaudefroyi]